MLRNALLPLAILLSLTAGLSLQAKERKRAPDTPQYDGIDISAHNGEIDWTEVAKDKNIKYVYIKATEGRDYHRRGLDYFHRNLKQARRHGIKVGAYHYLVASSPIRKQFDHFIQIAKPSEIDLIPMIDFELEKGPWSPQQARDSVKAFANLIEKHYGCRPIIYTYTSLFNTHLGLAFKNYPLFIAAYDKTPTLQSVQWTIHQFTDRGRVPGIRGNVDLSRFNKGHSLSNILYHRAKVAKKGKSHRRAKVTSESRHHKKPRHRAGKNKKRKTTDSGKTTKPKTPAKPKQKAKPSKKATKK